MRTFDNYRKTIAAGALAAATLFAVTSPRLAAAQIPTVDLNPSVTDYAGQDGDGDSDTGNDADTQAHKRRREDALAWIGAGGLLFLLFDHHGSTFSVSQGGSGSGGTDPGGGDPGGGGGGGQPGGGGTRGGDPAPEPGPLAYACGGLVVASVVIPLTRRRARIQEARDRTRRTTLRSP